MVSPPKIFIHNDKIYTSRNTMYFPDHVPRLAHWDPRIDHDWSPEDTEDQLRTCWAFASRGWFPLVPVNPRYEGPIFECLNHTRYSLRTEHVGGGRHILHRDIREKWDALETKLHLCFQLLGSNWYVPLSTIFPLPPSSYGYKASHADASLTRKVALRCRNAFLLFSTACTWFIMSRTYRGGSAPWQRILTDHKEHPIPAEWVIELSRSFVGDLSINVPRTGAFMTSARCPWSTQLDMFEAYGIPLWVLYLQEMPVHWELRFYIPTEKAIAEAVAQASVPQPVREPEVSGATIWTPREVGWDMDVDNQNPVHDSSAQDAVALGPMPERFSGQKRGETWQTFFARREEENKKREERESPVQRQSRLSRQKDAMNHKIPSKSNTVTVFEWQEQDDFHGFLLRVRLTKAEVPDTWGLYNNTTRVYDGFCNEWDLCTALDPASVPDGDWEEDDFPPEPAPAPSPAPPPPPSAPPSWASFLNDIHNYFKDHQVASSEYTAGFERLMSVLRFHLGFRHTATGLGQVNRSKALKTWTSKTKWLHLVRIIGDSGDDQPPIQGDIIQGFIGYLATLPQSELGNIPDDLWDLGVNTDLSASNAHITVSYARPLEWQEEHRLYIIESSQSRNPQIWKLAVRDAASAVMCLRKDWGPDIMKIAQKLLHRGIAFKTLQPMGVTPDRLPLLNKPHTCTLGFARRPFKPLNADYIIYEQHRHAFMKQPRARAALLHGGLVWRLALHSVGFDVLPSFLEGVSQEAVPFGVKLTIGNQSYFDDDLSEEEIDFMCGTYYLPTDEGNVEKVSWWPRPQAWNASGLNVGFWSSRCENWFQKRLENIRTGVSRDRHSEPNDGNGPMNGTKWKKSLKFNASTNKIISNVGAASTSFLDRTASAFKEDGSL